MTALDGLPLHEPASVADAADLHLRLRTLAEWAADRRDAVSAWLLRLGEDRIVADGAAPTWRLDVGTVVVTDPKPTPRIVDPEAFGRWLIMRDDLPPPAQVVTYDDPTYDAPHIAVRLVAEASSDALLAFMHAHHYDADPDDYPDRLAEAITMREEWFVDDAALTDLLDAGDVALAPDGGGWALVDVDTGEVVPGVDVADPRPRTVQMRPTTDSKRRVRDELEALLGSPQLATGDSP